MATPTPGILLNLLRSMNCAPPVRKHRSPLLQVTAILPALNAPNDLYSNQGLYFLQISDSLHSTYVSLPPSLSDSLILSNRLHLGQFVHLDRLVLDPSSSPLPFPSSLCPVPGVHPLLGSPSPLLVRCNQSCSSPSSPRDFVIQPVSDELDAAAPLSAYLLTKKPNPVVAFGIAGNENEGFCRSKKEDGGATVSRTRAALTPCDNTSNFRNPADVNDANCKESQEAVKCKPAKFSSSATAKKRSASVGKKPPAERDPSPMAVKGKRSASPSLAAAKEEGERKRVIRKTAIVVPSRYRQPSPNARKQGIIASVNPRSCSISPGRRLSGGVKVVVSPLVGNSCRKKKVVAISKASETGKARRKSWGNDDLDQKCKVDLSKCVVPSLAAAKEEGERKGVVRKTAIVVPSRHRQPSPNARKQGIIASVNPRRCSISPGRRLSGGVKVVVSPLVGDSCRKEKVVAISKATETGMAGRKSWGNDDSDEKCKVDTQVILRTKAAISRRLSYAGKPNGEDSPSNGRAKPAAVEAIKAPPAIVIHEKKWTDSGFPLDSISKELKRLGQDAMQRRTIASIAASEALEEAAAAEAILRTLSMFSDLCSVTKAENPMLAIERFFMIYEEVLKSARTAESIDRNRSPAVENVPSGKSNFSIWVETALATDLQIVNFLTGQNIDPASTPKKNELLKWQSIKDALQPNMELKSPRDWTRGLGVKENIELSQKLQSEMQSWFLRFIEESLDARFQVFGERSRAAVLSNLKRVNDWLDRVASKPDGILMEKIYRLKRKIYSFVIKHVGSTHDDCAPPAATSNYH